MWQSRRQFSIKSTIARIDVDDNNYILQNKNTSIIIYFIFISLRSFLLIINKLPIEFWQRKYCEIIK